MEIGNYAEAATLLRENVTRCSDALGANHDISLHMRCSLGRSLCLDEDSSDAVFAEGKAFLEDVVQTGRRILGTDHPYVKRWVDYVDAASAIQRARSQGNYP